MNGWIRRKLWDLYVKFEDKKRNTIANMKIKRKKVDPPKTLHIAKIKHEVKNG